ncbi:MAG TPA: zinc ribbon domain-containing protein [Planctomycetota bacterium]|nr:zinc ribbon domain-containing protein [Planctomycetota bacterium]
MTRACPFCAAEIEDVARLCPSCGGTVLKACPFCDEDVLASARVCRWCKSNLASPTGEGPAPAPPPPQLTERGITAIVGLGLLTCGMYAFYVLHEQMREVQAHAGGKARGLEPTRDLVLSIATHVATLGMFPFWIYYVMFVYARAFQETCVAEEIPCRDLVTPTVMLAVMTTSLLCVSLVIPVWIFAVAVFQNELNKHVRLHREVAALAF